MIDNKSRIKKLKENKFQELFGVKKDTFYKMLEILENTYIDLHKQGGKKPKLSVLDKLVITLSYYREYRVMENIAFDYDVVKSTVSDSISWVEETLIKDGTFSLPNKRELQKEDIDVEVLLVDVTESEIERPKKNKKNGTQEKRRNIQ